MSSLRRFDDLIGSIRHCFGLFHDRRTGKNKNLHDGRYRA